MQHTVFDTPGIRDVLRFVSHHLLMMTGWRVAGPLPDIRFSLVLRALLNISARPPAYAVDGMGMGDPLA